MPDINDTQPIGHKPQCSNPPVETHSIRSDPRDGKDALCFTPGFPGASFGAGAIHAYLAADREPPQVVAGISLGTLSAAVMQRSYADLCAAKKSKLKDGAIEAARWKFFRKYLSFITHRPFDVLWKGIPDPADFVAELPPIQDPGPDTIADPDLQQHWKTLELAARAELYLLVKLGHWLAKLPIRVSTIANTLVSYVRSKEKYPSSKIVRFLEAKLWQLAVLVSLILHVVRVPARFPDYKFEKWREEPVSPFCQFHWTTALRWLREWQNGWLRFCYGVVTVVTIGLFAANLLVWALFLAGRGTVAPDHLENPAGPVWFTFISIAGLGLLQVTFLSLISRQDDPHRPALPAWWFHLRSAARAVAQPPLFGWPLYASSFALLAVLQVYTTILALSSLTYLGRNGWYHVPFAFAAGIMWLFFTTSLATWWIPMKGKFPFRAVPLLCSVVFVTAFTVVVHTDLLQRVFVDKDWPLGSHDHWTWWQISLDLLEGLLGHPLIPSLIVLVLTLVVVALALAPEVRDEFIKSLLKRVKMEKHLVHDYHLKWALSSLFSDNADSPLLTNEPFPLVLVATPLQSLGTEPALNNQLWANVASKPKVADVLRATLAVPGIVDPYTACGPEVKVWYKSDPAIDSLDLVDASIVRHNPLPAFFNFIRRNYEDHVRQKTPQQAIATFLSSQSPAQARVHVVYNVPAKAAEMDQSQQKTNQPQQKLDNIIDVAFLSLRLAQRRDINLEIDQTNFIARLARVSQDLLGDLPGGAGDEVLKEAPSPPIFPIFADHISPDSDLSFSNPIAPRRDEVLRHAAAGCKSTLQQLYAVQINEISKDGVECPRFLTLLRKQKDPRVNGKSGLPEICEHCDKHLKASRDSGRKAVFDDQEIKAWRDRNDLDIQFPQLTSEEPRIVFVASGGVFRGPFHAGMVNAMLALDVKPDLVVGASVGTLVGAALAATLAATTRKDSLGVLGALADAFQQSDQRIAFTKTLKNAARELGIRSRSVDLAPYELRKKILEGTQSDPGFAVTGTPPVLIDAISDILLIPHGETARIAAEFVAGHFTNALHLLVAGVRNETLQRLDIVDAVMGASLLEPTARTLLGSMLGYDMFDSQPYQKSKIAIFGTSTDLRNEQPVLFGRYRFDRQSYDFVNACLASSAFPAVFAPRKEDQIFPGLGDPEKIFSDGGMFDNLPISPALEILTASQRSWIPKSGTNPVAALGSRVQNPDLFITGSLDEIPSPSERVFDNLVSIKKRAGTLQNNVKILAFEEVTELVSGHIEFLHRIVQAYTAQGRPVDESYLNGLVNTALLSVYPADAEHLNGTFQFCDSMGRKPEVINRSMADGCFQTLATLAQSCNPKATSFRAKTVQNFISRKKIPELIPITGPRGKTEASDRNGYYCPFFQRSVAGTAVRFSCPFSEIGQQKKVFESCIKDEAHT
ncbi:MAG TPA: patatin-like phospholipase family protein [Candidatus Angelobacter sp.]|nr:patatin-like phospholipase family protein [Candidatus Angelobacter sp.]